VEFSRSLLRSTRFLLQNPVILRNAARISLPLVSSEKHTAQHLEKLRKQSCLNYKSAALPTELCRRCPYESRFSEFIKRSPDDHAASRITVTLLTSKQSANSTRARARDDLRYGLCRLLSSSSLRWDCSLTQCASNNSIGSLPLTDSDWLVRVESDNARISSRISASRSGGSGDMLICYRRRRLKIVSAVTLFLVVRTDSQRRHLPVNVAHRPGRTRAGASCMQEFGSQRWVVSNPAGIGRLRDSRNATKSSRSLGLSEGPKAGMFVPPLTIRITMLSRVSVFAM
jgi:hypothetical protein